MMSIISSLYHLEENQLISTVLLCVWVPWRFKLSSIPWKMCCSEFTLVAMSSSYEGAPLNDDIARKIDKKPVMCFLKDYDSSYDSSLETTFPIVKLYTEEQVICVQAPAAATLGDHVIESGLDASACKASEKEKQLFNSSSKRVVDEMATKLGIDQGEKRNGIWWDY